MAALYAICRLDVAKKSCLSGRSGLRLKCRWARVLTPAAQLEAALVAAVGDLGPSFLSFFAKSLLKR
jgi:hypothetical protein